MELIDRKMALEAICRNCIETELCNGVCDDTDAIRKVPTIEPKHGKWIDGKYMGFDGCFVWHRECSECWYERDDDDPDKDTNYCPNCGAKMDEVEDV